MKWLKLGKAVKNGETIITYAYGDTIYTVQSVKHAVPHANGKPGTWNYTSFHVFENGVPLLDKATLKDAKAAVERICGKEEQNER